MAGRVKQLIDELIELRAGGNATVEHFLRAHLMLNGIDPSVHTAASPDDAVKERRLRDMIKTFSRHSGST
jgi:hypothetical protein